jgi:hypothetical protein
MLPPLYYLDNFEALWRVVRQRYADLLTPEEAGLMACFDAAPQPVRCLFVRLLTRRGSHFRVSRLDYPELGELAPAVRGLLEAGLADDCRELDAATLGQLFTRAELREAFAYELSGLPAAAAKGTLLAALEARLESPLAACEAVCAGGREQIIAVRGSETLQVLQLLFFGNTRQSLVDFVLSDIGVATYWPYALDRSQRLFPDRAAVDVCLRVAALGDAHWQWRDAGDSDTLAALVAEALALPDSVDAARARIHRLRNRLARDCERAGCLHDSLSLYERSAQHPARERRARVLERLDDLQAALALCETALRDPWCEEERAAVRRIATRLRRRLYGQRRAAAPVRFERRELCLPPASARVESLAAQALEAQGWDCVRHVENALFNGLFALAFWDALFAPVAGAFHHPFQAGPADMFSRDFRQRRADLLENRLQALAACDLKAELLRAHERCAGYQCRWVDWRVLRPELVARSATCIPFRHLVAAWRRLLFDPAENRRGQPDLVALGSRPGEYALWEVKGPGDALQPHQARWLDYLCGVGAPAGVLQVSWAHA